MSGKEIYIPHEQILILEPATQEDYWKWSTEDLKVEYSQGVLFIHSPASFQHEDIFQFLITYFRRYFDENQNGKVLGSRFAIKLPNGHRPEPDLVFLYPNHIRPDMTVFEGIPPLVIEIISPGTRNHDLSTKLNWFQESLIPEIWLIDLKNEWIRQYTLVEGKYTMQELGKGSLRSYSFPTLGIQIEWLWKYPRPKVNDLPISVI